MTYFVIVARFPKFKVFIFANRVLPVCTTELVLNLLCILLKGNHTNFLVQFGNKFILVSFSKGLNCIHQRAYEILVLTEKPTCANYFQIELKIV